MVAEKYVDPVEAERLYHIHKSVPPVAEAFGVSNSKIQRVLKGKLIYARHKPRPMNRVQFDHDEAYRLWLEHRSTARVGEILGIDRGVVQRALRDMPDYCRYEPLIHEVALSLWRSGKSDAALAEEYTEITGKSATKDRVRRWRDRRNLGRSNIPAESIAANHSPYRPYVHEIMLSSWRSGLSDSGVAGEYAELTGRQISKDQARRWRNRNHLPVNKQPGHGRPPPNKGKRKYDWNLGVSLLREGKGVTEVMRALGCRREYVLHMRHELGMPSLHPQEKYAPFEERLKKAAQMVQEGASFAEIERTTHVNGKTLRKRFPGKQWTNQQALKHAIQVRWAEYEINRAWSAAGKTAALTNPPLTK